MRAFVCLLCAFLACMLLEAPGFADPGPEATWVPVGFVILRSTADYSEAKRVAEEAATRMKIPLDLRGLGHDKEHGLTWPKGVCAKDFAPGFFIVLAASGAPGSPELMKTVVAARSFYADAYSKQTSVYVGCMH